MEALVGRLIARGAVGSAHRDRIEANIAITDFSLTRRNSRASTSGRW
jgi:hypothetical protein